MWVRACVGAVLFSGCVTTIAQGLPHLILPWDSAQQEWTLTFEN